VMREVVSEELHRFGPLPRESDAASDTLSP
jgi:hypothetical protein